jgi:hypothetical protein
MALDDSKDFEKVEKQLIADGTIPSWVEKNGPIEGRMYVHTVVAPTNLSIKIDPDAGQFAFEGSFDFINTVVGIAIDFSQLPPVPISQLWSRNGEANDLLVEMLVNTIMANVEPDGRFGNPMYMFFNQNASFTMHPDGRK